MKIHTFPYGLVQANMYVVAFGDSAIVIDPCVHWEKTALTDLDVKAVLCTHGHFDHISTADELISKFSCPCYIAKEDQEMLPDPRLNFAIDFGIQVTVKQETVTFTKEEYSNLDFGIAEPFSLTVISTPGHTEGSVCFLFETKDNKKYMFTGDMLFEGSVGRTDLDGSESDMKASIQKLKAMDDSIRCYPGHGGETVLGLEKEHNPYFLYF